MQEQTIEAVAEGLGVSPSTVRTWADMAGLPMRRGYRGRRLFTPDDVARLGLVARMREQGQDPGIIRAALGVPTMPASGGETVTTLAPSVDSQSPQWVDRLAGTLEAAIGEGERWGAVLARLHALEVDLRAAQDRVAALEVARQQAEARITALEARRPRLGWVAGSFVALAMAGALLGRPVPADAAGSASKDIAPIGGDISLLKFRVYALESDVFLLKVAANTLAWRDQVGIMTHMFGLRKGETDSNWQPFPEFGCDLRRQVQTGKTAPSMHPLEVCDPCTGIIPSNEDLATHQNRPNQ